MRNAKEAPGWSAATSCSSVTPNKNSQLSRLSIESLIQPDVTLKPSAWLPPAVTNVPAPNRGVQTGRHFPDFYQTEFINSDSRDVWEQLPPTTAAATLHISMLRPETRTQQAAGSAAKRENHHGKRLVEELSWLLKGGTSGSQIILFIYDKFGVKNHRFGGKCGNYMLLFWNRSQFVYFLNKINELKVRIKILRQQGELDRFHRTFVILSDFWNPEIAACSVNIFFLFNSFVL